MLKRGPSHVVARGPSHVAATAAIATSLLLASAPACGLAASHTARAHTAKALRATDVAHLRYLSASGSLLHERGSATGTLPGSMRADVRIEATFSGNFTIYARGGSIRGRGVAIPHGAGVYESFAGSLTVTGGSGRFARAHGKAKLYGTFNRNSYAMLVQTVGTLLY